MNQGSKSAIYKDAPGTVMVRSYHDSRMAYSIGMCITHKLLRRQMEVSVGEVTDDARLRPVREKTV